MPRRGAWETRNASHKAEQARRFAQAQSEDEMLAAAFGWFRSSVALLTRRRVPFGYSQEVNRTAAARLKREMAAHLKAHAEAVDRGHYDAGRR